MLIARPADIENESDDFWQGTVKAIGQSTQKSINGLQAEITQMNNKLQSDVESVQAQVKEMQT